MTRIDLLGVPIDAQRFEDAVGRILDAARGRQSLRAHFVTVHSLIEATEDPRLSEVFGTATMACTDGMPLVWLARRAGAREAQRCAGPDVMLAVCDQGRASGLRHFFLGGAPGTADLLAERLRARYPGLEVAGTASPPFRPLTPAEDQALNAEIEATAPNVLWVGLGSPKQDFWSAEHQGGFDVPVILAVGAAFDFHSGRLRRAPRWMQRLGLEWLFRLVAEPRRLARRYLTTNARFLWLVVRQALSRRGRR
jgi:N-acetylglucosaminyldiphosphoundecaprenol N-acetyl-beta-D-mannosaminyltransferase